MVDQRRARVFGEDAGTYDDARPGYPPGAIDVIVADDPARAYDVGCGTGIASRLVAARGVAVVGIEPDVRMAAVARRRGLEVVASPFEGWAGPPRDCVFSAQAWHWVDPERGASTAAALLVPGGRWAAMWNREDDPAATAALDEAYGRHAPALAAERIATRDDAGMVERIAAGLHATGSFAPVDRHDVRWTDDITVATLVARLSTHSHHRLLPASTAAAVHGAITDVLGGPDVSLRLGYTTLVLTALRR